MKKIPLIPIIIIFFLQSVQTGQAYTIEGKHPYDYEQLITDLNGLKQEYCNTLTIEQIGQSHLGKPIWAVHLGRGEKNILLVGAHHGREWITSNLLMMMLEHYANAYTNNIRVGWFEPSILDKVSIWFVPMLNPDGISIQQGKIPENMREKITSFNDGSTNYHRWKANGVGIDLNRQYPAGWSTVPSPSKPFYKFYKGKQPLEAKEVQALVQFVKKIKPQAAITYHSSGREIFWRYGNHQNIFRDFQIGQKLSFYTGYPLATPPKNATGGGFTDWFIAAFNRPSFTLELCDFQGETNPPIAQLHEEWERNQYIGFVLAEEAEKF
ncbi:M14 family zinc carboxypeptidase [Caldibacillus lycopersici]|uniref:M14 family zinc carboxypeptidase n=1 Tax=Perspicuibacillus lycopersici TaxID=1325689 RepID=A0AAE3IS01_9BACI|nr:M14 family zinc carboxypeptidase [Perspicuibacillus lycopersici]MCU9612558.1 M14 family zinc carboxypeptidase [Perspicuibacillus lycopersici]